MTSVPQPVDVAHTVATAATSLPEVERLYQGALGEIATYGRGERVGGVRLHDVEASRIEVHVVARYGRPLPEVAEEVRAVVSAALLHQGMHLRDLAIDVRIADLVLPRTPA